MPVSLGVGRAKTPRAVQLVVVGLLVRQRGAPKLRSGTRRIHPRKQPARRDRSVQEQTVRHRTAMERR